MLLSTAWQRRHTASCIVSKTCRKVDVWLLHSLSCNACWCFSDIPPLQQHLAYAIGPSLTSCVKKYADSDTILLCILKRWMYSRLEASCGGLAWMTTYISTGRKSSAPAGTCYVQFLLLARCCCRCAAGSTLPYTWHCMYLLSP